MKTVRILAIQIATIIGAWYALDAYLYSTDGLAESPIFGIIVAGCFFLAPHLIRSS